MSGSNDSGDAADRQLTSWKEIAAYLQRDVRTVQRWEKNEGLPVHRQMHDVRASVYVTTRELDDWVARRSIRADTEPEIVAEVVAEAASPGWRGQRWVPVGVGVVAVFVAASFGLWKSSIEEAAAPASATVAATPAGEAKAMPVVGPEKDDGVVRIRPLLQRPDIDGAGAVSADGRFLPYRNTSAQLMLYNTETGQSQVVLREPENVRRNFLNFIASPDGSRIAYMLESADGGGELRVLKSDGTGEKVLFANPKYTYYNPRSWSHDGRWIGAVLWEADGFQNVAVIDAQTGSQKVLYRNDTPPANAQISPDARYVAFNEKSNVYAVAVAGGAPIEMAGGPARETLVGWAPDGRLVFSSDRSGTTDLWAVAFRDGVVQGEPEMLWKEMSMTPLGITKSGDLYFSRGNLQNDLYTAELSNGKFVKAPALLPRTRFQGKNHSPDYSPDGKTLAYVSPGEDGGGQAIRLRTLTTGDEREIVLNMIRVNQLRWYRDGKALLVQGGHNGKLGFFRVLNDGRTVAEPNLILEVAQPHLASNPTFSVDGGSLYYDLVEGTNQAAVVRVDLETGSVTRVVETNEGLVRMFSISTLR